MCYACKTVSTNGVNLSRLHFKQTESHRHRLGLQRMLMMLRRASLKLARPRSALLHIVPRPRARHHRPLSTQPEADNEEEVASLGMFSEYLPTDLGGGPHPAALVETTALASVRWAHDLQNPFDGLPPPGLSNVQLEAIALASSAHDDEDALTAFGSRRGFFLADGTGCGKGRTIAGTILLSHRAGRVRSVWVSSAANLIQDAKRDLDGLGVGLEEKAVTRGQHSWKRDQPIDLQEGVLFTTYALLCRPGRIDQLRNWCGDDFDGVIGFDEVHKANAPTAASASRKLTASATAVRDLQARLPQARVVYASATGANDVSALGQLARLHLWGGDSPFDSDAEFEAILKHGGKGAAELLAMELKQRGLYVARRLSFGSVQTFSHTLPMSAAQRRQYDDAAQLWLDLKASTQPTWERRTSAAYYWSAHLSFFQQLLLSFKVELAAAAVRQAVDLDGYAAVIGLQSTGAAAARTAASEDRSDDETASSCLETLLRTIERLCIDESDRAKYADLAAGLHLPPAALPTLIAKLGGSSAVAELTGRSPMERGVQSARGSGPINLTEAAAFNSGEKLIAIISAAASTGISLHSDPCFDNARRRNHFTLELGWAAASVVQQLGRTVSTSGSKHAYPLLRTSDERVFELYSGSTGHRKPPPLSARCLYRTQVERCARQVRLPHGWLR